ncbi:MAG: hypothetical protein IKL19_01080 [Paludibacteraceae bacterium]|nr:hypothetical protein [Bacteroidales bacterium]MBO5133340.1 hypothetical protein [Paludibacteraceae bacterium]MBQ9100848.1 hypothetical protein [Paludibacteraceae bacterium]MBR6658652.1 hypothetical protein [Paludibacteraceae bacterium]
MKRWNFLFICFSLAILLFSCNSDEVEGVSDEEVSQNVMNGGWEFEDFECQLNYNTANPLAILLPSLKESLLENVQERLHNGVLYFKDSVVYFAQRYEDGTLEYYRGSYYQVYQNPARIELENATLLSGAYTPVMFVKFEAGRLCLYLNAEQTMELIRKDGSIEDSYVNMIEENIDDAQFEFYLKKVDLPFFKDFE